MKKEGHAIGLHGLFELRSTLNNSDLPTGFQECMEAALFLNLLGNILLSCYTGNSQPIHYNCFLETRFEVFYEVYEVYLINYARLGNRVSLRSHRWARKGQTK